MSNTPKSHQDDKVNFYYEKSNFFRVIHTDGVHGGISPQLNIHMAVFSERRPIPQQITHVIDDHGMLGSEDLSLRVEKDGMFREVEADIVLSVELAKTVVGWLNDRIKEAEKVKTLIPEK